MIVRISERHTPYTMIANTVLQDRQITHRARGVLTYLLSRPANWETRLADLQGPKEGRDAIQSVMRELKASGYATLERIAGQNGLKAGTRWVIHEAPVPVEPTTDKTDSRENRQPEKPAVGKTDHTKDGKEQKNDVCKAAEPELFEQAKPELPPAIDTPEMREAWAAFKQVRSRKRAPLTPLVLRRIFHDLTQWGPAKATEAVWTSARKGWTDIYPPKQQSPVDPTTTTKPITKKNALA